MTQLLGINHVTLSTTDLDRIVAYYTHILGGVLAFERAAGGGDPRIAVIDVGENDHLMVIETNPTPTPPNPPQRDFSAKASSAWTDDPLGTPQQGRSTKAPSAWTDEPLGTAQWGLRVGTYEQLCDLRERILAAGWPVSPIETLPTQWTMTTQDPDTRPLQIRSHRPPNPPTP